ncbi:Catalase/peroxidase HPI [Phytophthora cinnamomi]|uniref:Catalase/peroxidase HPI n=1 Tax=Phytophthora cinnamomi TaxID=4785 RepID=UPI00355A7505|nr:Catalase/peroxidase HPI [Phytophthora cinnamomi]
MKESYPTLSTADLVVLAGQVALEDAGNVTIDFLGGRTDANNGNARSRRRWATAAQYKVEGKGVYTMDTGLALLAAPELKEAVQLFALEEGVFKHLLNSA